MGFWLALGAGVAAYLSWGLFAASPGARAAGDHIAYSTGLPFSWAVALAYVAATTLPLLSSTRRAVQVLGLVILTGSAVAFAQYRATFQSVWCYFAAAASLVLLAHFEARHRRPAAA